ncbi:MAG TPA: hypothetical protein VKA44_09365, partial [Gemmatimonadota bacterium]|nr:hypothetical protein [Gemmatimonadota bacterium]
MPDGGAPGRAVRPARRDDVPAIAALHRKSFGDASALPEGDLEPYLLEVLFDGPWQGKPSSS